MLMIYSLIFSINIHFSIPSSSPLTSMKLTQITVNVDFLTSALSMDININLLLVIWATLSIATEKNCHRN